MKRTNFGEHLGPKVKVMVTMVAESSSEDSNDQISTAGHKGNNATDQDNHGSYRGMDRKL